MAEYIVEVMGQHQGLSRGLIFAQLEREYGENVGERVARFVRASAGSVLGFSVLVSRIFFI